MSNIDKLVPFQEAIVLAGMRRSRAYSEVAAGRLAIVKNGRRSFIRASEIERYISQLEKAAPPRARPVAV